MSTITKSRSANKTPTEEILAIAKREHKRAKSWVAFYNVLFGIGGKCSELFPTQAERSVFAKSNEYRQITDMLHDLQGDDPSATAPAASANGAISVRMPKSIHAALLAEAEDEGVSLNQLCVAKLSTQLRAVVH